MKNRAFPVLPPERLDREIVAKFPKMDDQAADFLRDPPDQWPEWCYLPMSASYAIVSDGAMDNPDIALALGGGTAMLGKMAADIAWKHTKAIYAFDNELTQMLITQTHDEPVPVETLLHFPVPGVYIAYPPMVEHCVGLYAFWEYDFRYKIPELRLHYLMEDGEMRQIFLQFKTMDSTLHDAVELAFRGVGSLDAEFFAKSIIMDAIAPGAKYWDLGSTDGSMYDVLGGHINMLLYLCSDEPDVATPTEPRIAVKRGGVEYPKHPASYAVGTRIGASIRRAREDAEREYDASISMGHASPRPHVRRAHWHSFWTGKLGEKRNLIVKWLPPVFVCVGKEFRIDTTIYPVK